MNSSITKKNRQALAEALLNALPGDRRTSKHDLDHGFRIMSSRAQLASAYFSENAHGHQVEFALNDVHLVETDHERIALGQWLLHQKGLFGRCKPNVHKRGASVDWFRIGFASVDDAMTFLRRFNDERRQMLDPRVRWQIPVAIFPEVSETASLVDVGGKSEVPEPPSASKGHVNTWEQAVGRMVNMAQQTTVQSNGQSALKTIKNKDNEFASQEEFARHVLALIEQRDGCCAISGLPLQPDGQCDDVEMLASLDRIDSNGHYKPGNLQVVCRFINRWKGAEENGLFVRLIGDLRRYPSIAASGETKTLSD